MPGTEDSERSGDTDTGRQAAAAAAGQQQLLKQHQLAVQQYQRCCSGRRDSIIALTRQRQCWYSCTRRYCSSNMQQMQTDQCVAQLQSIRAEAVHWSCRGRGTMPASYWCD